MPYLIKVLKSFVTISLVQCGKQHKWHKTSFVTKYCFCQSWTLSLAAMRLTCPLPNAAYIWCFFQSLRLLINQKLTYRLGINLWHWPQTWSIVHQVQLLLHTKSPVISRILKPQTKRTKRSDMCGRHPNRLVWRDQAFKIEQYFQTHYLLFNGMELCHKYTSPVYFNGLGSANVKQQAVSKIQCGARLYGCKTFITAVANLENNECLCEFSCSYASVYVTRHISLSSSILLPWQTWLQIFFSLFTVITLFQAFK